jgi:hypothetical protein
MHACFLLPPLPIDLVLLPASHTQPLPLKMTVLCHESLQASRCSSTRCCK